MQISGLIGRLSVVAACGLAAACTEDDDKARVNLPTEPIAMGAYFPLTVSDACAGGGKISFCTGEELVSIDGFSVEDPRIAALLRMEQLDESLQIPYSELVIDAKAAGSTTVTIDTTFDDGSQRAIETTVDVAKADRMELLHGCSVREPDDSELFPVGAQVALTIELSAGKQRLKGEHQRDLIEGQGITREAGLLTRNAYVWTAPDVAGETSLGSALLPKFSASYRAYDFASLAIESVTRKYQGPSRYHTFVAFDATLTVDGKHPCELPPLRMDTLTPEVCDGPDGANSWLEESPAYGISARAVSSGSCELTVTVEGTETIYPVQAELEVTDVPVVEVDPCEGVVCEEEPASCADGSALAIRECCKACVPVPDAEQCEVERAAFDELYEAQLAQATACQQDADCAPVVLVGGCREYCYVALNAQSTADFMNAITPEYQTSCVACAVTDPAPSECSGDGRVYCASGECRMLR
jgi:hypothetical protein